MKTYTIAKTVKTDGIKTAQVLALISILTGMKVETATSEDIAKVLTTAVTEKKLVTRQDPMLIFRYYIRELKSSGTIAEVGEVVKTNRTITIPEPTNVIDGLGNMW